jgi:hypothetical protein
MIEKITNSKIIIFFVLFSIIITKIVDDTDESQILEGILEAMKNLKIPYKSLDDTIDHKTYIKLLKYLVLNDAESFGMLSGLEDTFLLKLSKEVTQTIPKDIKIKELPKYLNPRMIEPLINNILSEFDFNSMLKDFGDAFGITDIFNEKKEEWEKKDKEREKINQARIKRKQEREKAKLNQNITNNNSSDIDNEKKRTKKIKRDLRINNNDTNNDINKDL